MKISSSTSSFIDMMRWISAMLVFLGHLRNTVFVAYDDMVSSNILIKGFVFFSAFGRPAVMVFFFLSGYLVGAALLEKVAQSRNITIAMLVEYLVHRLSRLYVVLLPALIMIFLFAFFMYLSSGGEDKRLFTHEYSLNTFIINIFFGQTIIGPNYGDNYPLWSLANEFWYYILFPVLLLGLQLRKSFMLIPLMLILGLSLYYLKDSMILPYFIVWFFGAGLYFIKRSLVSPIYALIIFLIASTISRVFYSGGNFYMDAAVGASFALLLNSMMYVKNVIWLRSIHEINKKLAGFSYLLYVAHVPVIIMLLFPLQAIITDDRAQPSLPGWLVYIYAGILTVLVSYYFSRVTEGNTGKVRRFFSLRVNALLGLSSNPSKP